MAVFTNQASLTYNGKTINSNIVTGEVTQPLTLMKSATVEAYGPNDLLTYVISIRNSGSTSYNNLTLTDNLGAYIFNGDTAPQTLTPLTYTGEPVLYYVGGVQQTAPAVTAGPPLMLTGINIPAGSNVVIIYRVCVNEFASPAEGASIVNTVTLTGDGLAEAITATHTLPACIQPKLSIFKALKPTTVVENGRITYTFTIRNMGLAAATGDANIVITDVFNPILNTPLTVTLNGAVLSAGNYRYAVTNGAFSTLAGVITVPAATYTRNSVTGAYTITPGVTVLTVSGTI